jgi:four helix bundle protein
MKDFKQLKIWQNGIEIVKSCYELITYLDLREKYGLKSQITRAAVSIPANIAEGSSRTSEKEYKHFLEISLG